MKSLIDRLLGRMRKAGGRSRPSEPAAMDGDSIDALRDHIRREVAAGFYDEDVILTNAVDAFDEDVDAAQVRRAAPALLRAALAEHAAAEAQWPDITDCDRLDAAFAALEMDGVVARQNFSCCMTCGSGEIWEEIQIAQESGVPARGYTFFHMQDTDRAIDGEGIFLAYGACEDGEDAALAVGRDIVAQLEAHGLRTHWDGSWNQRIGVVLDWQKRRVPVFPMAGLGGVF